MRRTMFDDVNNKEFWRERLNRSKKSGRIHYSVFLANDSLWRNIENEHRKIIDGLIPKKANVLDAGCGYGRASGWFENYVGVDFSDGFIDEAKKLYPDKKFVCADLRELPFRDGEFDWAIAISVKHMIQAKYSSVEWEKMQKEIKRVAKKLLILEYSDPGINESSNYEII